jgi:hypothetical protein
LHFGIFLTPYAKKCPKTHCIKSKWGGGRKIIWLVEGGGIKVLRFVLVAPRWVGGDCKARRAAHTAVEASCRARAGGSSSAATMRVRWG